MSGCASVFDAYRMAVEWLGPDLHRRASYDSVWLNLIPRDEYPVGGGVVLSTFTIERSEPTNDEETWARISSDPLTHCQTTWNDMQYGMTETTYAPETFGMRGPIICEDNAIYEWNVDRFTEGYMTELTKRARRSIENRLQALYMHYVPRYVTNSTFTKTDGGGTVPTGGPSMAGLSLATCELSQEHLDTVAVDLNEEGANHPDEVGWITLGDNGPLYTLLIGQEASQQIALNNAEFRQDIRWAEPSQLLKRMGAARTIKSFRHIINPFPPRYNFLAGSYQRIPTWLMPNATKGKKAILNPTWKAAAYEVAIVLNPAVFQSRLIRPKSMVGPLAFDPLNYMGEWQWVTGGKEITDASEEAGTPCYDPLKKLGRHFAEFKHAPEPIFPQYGRWILHKRCVNDYSCVTCTS